MGSCASSVCILNFGQVSITRFPIILTPKYLGCDFFLVLFFIFRLVLEVNKMDIKCVLCNKTFHDLSSMRRHVRTFHMTEDGKVTNASKEPHLVSEHFRI